MSAEIHTPAGADWRENYALQEPAFAEGNETLDQAHARLGHTAPRVTPADLEHAIVDVEIVKHVAKSGQILRWAVLTLRNGYAHAGDPSAAVSAANDSEELGTKFAIENAKRSLWPLLGYALKEHLHNQAPDSDLAFARAVARPVDER